MTTQISIRFCVLVLGICLSIGLWESEWTIIGIIFCHRVDIGRVEIG